MRLIIFANGSPGPVELRPDDRIIAADGGTRHALAQGIFPQVVIGDLDSITPGELQRLEEAGTEIRRYPQRKDHTDLELALMWASEQPADEVVIVTALGDRWDQTLANLLLPAALPDRRVMLLDGPQEIHYLASGETLEITGRPGDTVSLIALGDEARGISTAGLEYPLDGETLRFGSTRGVSNALTGAQARVTLGEGRLACTVIHRDDPQMEEK